MSGRCKHREVEPGQDAGFWPCVAAFWAEDKYNQKLACMVSTRHCLRVGQQAARHLRQLGTQAHKE